MELLTQVGSSQTVDGRTVVAVEAGKAGFALYGPFWRLLPGAYEVRFQFVLPSSRKDSLSEEAGVRVDASVDHGHPLAERRLSEKEIWNSDGIVILPFTLDRYTEIEVRVESTGAFPVSVLPERHITRNGQPVTGPFRYSQPLEDDLARHAGGQPGDGSEPAFLETYGKLDWIAQFFAFMDRYVKIGKGTRFLEAGCGTGITAANAAMRGAEVTMTEIDSGRLSFAERRLADMGYKANGQIWDIREPNPAFRQAFDFVWCCQIIEHIPRDGHFPAIKSVLECVAPGGYAFIDTENRWCPYDAHDTRTWLLRLLNKPTFEGLIEQLGRSLDYYEPSSQKKVIAHDYISYDELVGAAAMLGFEVVDPFMPHGSQKQYFRVTTGSDWFHDAIGQYFDLASFSRIAVLLHRKA